MREHLNFLKVSEAKTEVEKMHVDQPDQREPFPEQRDFKTGELMKESLDKRLQSAAKDQ
jgi:hypothetical protein